MLEKPFGRRLGWGVFAISLKWGYKARSSTLTQTLLGAVKRTPRDNAGPSPEGSVTQWTLQCELSLLTVLGGQRTVPGGAPNGVGSVVEGLGIPVLVWTVPSIKLEKGASTSRQSTATCWKFVKIHIQMYAS